MLERRFNEGNVVGKVGRQFPREPARLDERQFAVEQGERLVRYDADVTLVAFGRVGGVKQFQKIHLPFWRPMEVEASSWQRHSVTARQVRSAERYVECASDE